jgi:DNA-binding response OmpR family regulator
MHVIINGTRVPLTSRELWLLHALMDNANRVLSRDQLMRLAWGEQFVGVAKTVDVCIQRIRKKMAPHLSTGYIHAMRGFGYGLHLPYTNSDGTAGPRAITELLPTAVA